jgi:hypothetical protein
MSTRLGIRREGSLLTASVRDGENGRKYYDVAVSDPGERIQGPSGRVGSSCAPVIVRL